MNPLDYDSNTIRRPGFGVASVLFAGIPWIFLFLAIAGIRAGYLVIFAWMIFFPIAAAFSITGFIRHEPSKPATVGLLLIGAFFVFARVLL